MLLCFTVTGCTGSFNLTKKVYNMHRSQSDKWADEIGFLVCVLVPVYGVATFADAIVFNSIEFWTGKNPIEMSKAGVQEKFVKVGNQEATLSYDPATDKITVSAAGVPPMKFEKADGMVRVNDQNGNLLYAASQTEAGNIDVYDSNMKLVKSYSASDVANIKGQFTN